MKLNAKPKTKGSERETRHEPSLQAGNPEKKTDETIREPKRSAQAAGPDTDNGEIEALNLHPPRSGEGISGMSPPEKQVEPPDDLAAVLGRTKDSLGKADPVFPPGAFMITDRHFAPILRPVDRAEAEHLAKLAGGIIAVPATAEEADGIQEGCQFLKAPNGFWLGGMKSDSLWRWDSGESWTFARWARGTDHDLESAAMVFVPGAGWRNADPSSKASGVLIEWSRDPQVKPMKQEDDPIAILSEFDPPALKSVEGKTRILDGQLAGNAKDFRIALSHWLRKLPNDRERLQWQPQVDALNNLVAQNNRIPDAAKFDRRGAIKLTPDMAEACMHFFLKQQKYDADFTSGIAVIRDYQLKYLKKSADDFLSKGQIALAGRISAKAEVASDLDAWLASLRNEEAAMKEPGAGANESPVVGRWKWMNRTTVLIREDGTVLNQKSKGSGTWKLSDDRVVVVDWDGGKWIDTLGLSADGQHLTGKNQKGYDVSAVRIPDKN